MHKTQINYLTTIPIFLTSKKFMILPIFSVFLLILSFSIHNVEATNQISIPTWVKNNAKYWSQGQLGDNDFVSGIQYLIQQGIMQIPQTQAGSASSQQIPTWVKKNAGWWADGQISDDEFVTGIQYMISNGIMQINSQVQSGAQQQSTGNQQITSTLKLATPLSIDNLDGPPLRIETSDKNIYVEGYSWHGNSYEPMYGYVKSTDGGNTFNNRVNLTSTHNLQILAFTIVHDNIYAILLGPNPNNYDGMYFSKSTDGGNTFSDPILISDKHEFTFPQIAVSGDDIYIEWIDASANTFLSRSTDGGNTFSDPQTLSITNPLFVVSGNNIYLVSYNNGTYTLTRSTNNGNTFSSVDLFTLKPGYTEPVDLVASDNHVYVIFANDDNSNAAPDGYIKTMHIMKSDDYGATFSNQIKIGNDDTTLRHDAGPYSFQFAASGNNLYLVWQGGSLHDLPIYFSKSTDGGNTFSNPMTLTKVGAASWVAVSDEHVYLIWSGYTGNALHFFFSTIAN